MAVTGLSLNETDWRIEARTCFDHSFGHDNKDL